MNRVLGDYMEKMLYKIFVSIDEHTQISEVKLYFALFLQTSLFGNETGKDLVFLIAYVC